MENKEQNKMPLVAAAMSFAAMSILFDGNKNTKLPDRINVVFDNCVIEGLNPHENADSASWSCGFIDGKTIRVDAELDEGKDEAHMLVALLEMLEDGTREYLNADNTLIVLYNNKSVALKANYDKKTLTYDTFEGKSIYIPITVPSDSTTVCASSPVEYILSQITPEQIYCDFEDFGE